MPFPAAEINPILPILKATLGSISTMELRLIRFFTEELYYLALYCLLFVLCVSFLPLKLTVGSVV